MTSTLEASASLPPVARLKASRSFSLSFPISPSSSVSFSLCASWMTSRRALIRLMSTHPRSLALFLLCSRRAASSSVSFALSSSRRARHDRAAVACFPLTVDGRASSRLQSSAASRVARKGTASARVASSRPRRVSFLRPPRASRTTSSSTAELDCAHTRTRGDFGAAPLLSAGFVAAETMMSTAAAMVCVLPVPGGPCTSTTFVAPRRIDSATARRAPRWGPFKPVVASRQLRTSTFFGGAGAKAASDDALPTSVRTERSRVDAIDASFAPFASQSTVDFADSVPTARVAASSRNVGVTPVIRVSVKAASRRLSDCATAERRCLSSAVSSGPPPWPVSHRVVADGVSARQRRTRRRVPAPDDDKPTEAETFLPDGSLPEPPRSIVSTQPNACGRSLVVAVFGGGAPGPGAFCTRTKSCSANTSTWRPPASANLAISSKDEPDELAPTLYALDPPRPPSRDPSKKDSIVARVEACSDPDGSSSAFFSSLAICALNSARSDGTNISTYARGVAKLDDPSPSVAFEKKSASGEVDAT